MKTTASKVRLTQSLATVSGTLAATVASSQASTVQITLSGNRLSSSIDALNADLTGDGTNDINIQSASGFSSYAGVFINGNHLRAYRTSTYVYISYSNSGNVNRFGVAAKFANGGVGVADQSGLSIQNIKYLNPISFSDARINGGASTQGYLEVNAFNSDEWNHTIALTRLVFDDASVTLGTDGLSTGTTYTEFVPEPSSLGLLALGAGGLLARRRRQAA